MKDKSGIARPWLYRAIRLAEALGLLTTLYGLTSSRWIVAAAGAGIIIASYKFYRNRFPMVNASDNGSMGMGNGGD